MMALNDEGPLVQGAALPRKQPTTHTRILTASPSLGKLPAIAIEYAHAVFAAPLSRGRREVYLRLRGAAEHRAVRLIASVASPASSRRCGGLAR